MRLPGIHLKPNKKTGRISYLPYTSASFPGQTGLPDLPPIYQIPLEGPRKSDPEPSSPSWVVSGGTLLPSMATAHTPTFMRPVLGAPMLHPLTPFTPLLMLGFGLNLALLAGEVLGVEDPNAGPTDPWGNPMAY